MNIKIQSITIYYVYYSIYFTSYILNIKNFTKYNNTKYISKIYLYFKQYTNQQRQEKIQMGKQLTPEMIIQRTKSDKFDSIKNLNLWGNELESVSAIKDLPNLEVLSLSVNRISSLKDFACCPKLTELYLRKNAVSDLSEVQYLKPLKQLRVLWLWDNPCTEIPNYRLIIIKTLPQLEKLDNSAITPEERDAASKISIEDCLIEEPPTIPSAPPAALHEIPKRKVEQAPLMSEKEVRPEQIVRESTHSKLQQKKVVAPSPARVEAEPQSDTRNENILCAVLALLKELDAKSLELVKRDIDRKIASKK